MNTTVTYEEADSLKAGKFLLKRGFRLCDILGCQLERLEEGSMIGVLYRDPQIPRKTEWFGLRKGKRWRVFLGRIYFNDPGRLATSDHWVFEVFGQRYVDCAQNIGRKMAEEFKVNILVRLISYDRRLESDLSNLCY